MTDNQSSVGSHVDLYDTTLRDGMQGQGMSLSVEEKIRVAHALDALGMQFIEAGFPSSNPKEIELFEVLAGESFKTAAIAAFGMTRRRDVRAEDDEALAVLAGSFAPVCTLVGKTWSLHLEKVTKVTREENLAMIEESVAFLRGEGKRVIYDAEHFFDGFSDDSAYALECVGAAVAGGAECVALCDTNGASLPSQVSAATNTVVESVAGRAVVGIHTHNDAECGVANALAAVEAGARHVQGTVNGYGERTGNANLISILPNLQLKLGFDCVPGDRIAHLTETAHLIDEICNVQPDPNQPYVGTNAFAHKGGMHVAGMLEDARTFEHVDPEVVGNGRNMLISELSGKGTVVARAADAGLQIDEAKAAQIVSVVKQRESEGYHYEAADASFDLLIRKESGDYLPLFRLESWRVIAERGDDGGVRTEATIKIWVGEERLVRTAEGNGPVNALDKALRDAIGQIHPHLKDIDLVNYKVRILNETKGTGAVTRVLIDASDGHGSWGAIGVSENIIEASWQALVDALEYGMQPGRDGHAQAVESGARSAERAAS
ncbi:MAG: citramalate synthase [Actinobacteria bacterium]|nr:citramalate synthase [Actinomycetota bacterium]